MIIFSHDHIEILISSSGEQLFFRHREGPWLPSLKLLHKCKSFCFHFLIKYGIDNIHSPLIADPFFLPLEQVDKGAIKFVLSGANIMCPGLTSPGAVLTPVDKGTTVVSF